MVKDHGQLIFRERPEFRPYQKPEKYLTPPLWRFIYIAILPIYNIRNMDEKLPKCNESAVRPQPGQDCQDAAV